MKNWIMKKLGFTAKAEDVSARQIINNAAKLVIKNFPVEMSKEWQRKVLRAALRQLR